MSDNKLVLDSNRHKAFLAEQRKDPITHEPLRAGDEIVICANDKYAFLAENWQGECPLCHHSETLSEVPSRNFPNYLGPKTSGKIRSDNRTFADITAAPVKLKTKYIFLLAFAIGSGIVFLTPNFLHTLLGDIFKTFGILSLANGEYQMALESSFNWQIFIDIPLTSGFIIGLIFLYLKLKKHLLNRTR